MQKIVEQVEIKRGTPKPKKIRPLVAQKVKARSKKQAEEFKKVEELRKEKEKQIDSRNAAKYMREAVKFATEVHPKMLEEKMMAIEERTKKMEAGDMLPTKRHLGARKYKARAQDFKELDEIEPKTSKVEATSEALREQFDSVFRRGLIEPSYTGKSKKRNHLPPIKYHNDPSELHREVQGTLRQQQGFGIIVRKPARLIYIRQ